MGWNRGYTIFESTVMGAYDLGVLSKDLLAVLMEPYRGTDIDSGGEAGLLSKQDGLNVQQVVIKTWGGTLPTKPDESAVDEDWEHYYETLSEEFYRVAGDYFGWA